MIDKRCKGQWGETVDLKGILNASLKFKLISPPSRVKERREKIDRGGQQTAGTWDSWMQLFSCLFAQLMHSQRKCWRYSFRQSHSLPPHSITPTTQKTHKTLCIIHIHLSHYLNISSRYIVLSVCLSRQSKHRASVSLLKPGQLSDVDVWVHTLIYMSECTSIYLPFTRFL